MGYTLYILYILHCRCVYIDFAFTRQYSRQYSVLSTQYSMNKVWQLPLAHRTTCENADGHRSPSQSRRRLTFAIIICHLHAPNILLLLSVIHWLKCQCTVYLTVLSFSFSSAVVSSFGCWVYKGSERYPPPTCFKTCLFLRPSSFVVLTVADDFFQTGLWLSFLVVKVDHQ